MSDPENNVNAPEVPPQDETVAGTPRSSDGPKTNHGAVGRRRVLWGLIVVLLGVLVGGSVGWTSQEVVYQSRGLIYIEPSMPSPADPTGQSVLPMFQGFVAGQVQLLHQSRTSEMAMLNEIWKGTGESFGPAAVERFQALRSILHKPGTQHIEITFRHARPEIAQAGVRALVEAYQRLAREVNDADQRLEYARAQVEVLSAKLRTTTQAILTLTEDYGGVEAMEVRHLAGVEQMLETEKALQEVRQAIVELELREHRPLTPGEIAVESPKMDEYLLELELLKSRIEHLLKKVDKEDERIQVLREELRVRKERIRRFAEEWNKARARSDGESTLEELKATEQALMARLEALRALSRTLGQRRADVERLKAERDDHNQQLDQMRLLLGQLEEQLQGTGRIKVYSAGSLPEKPYEDNRALYAGIGGLIGGLAALALFLFFGFVARRAGRAADANAYHAKVRAAVSLLPGRIGEWKGRDVELPPAAAKLAKPNVAIGREFMNPSTGENATLRIVQCKDARDLSAYYPPIQYPAEGWTLREAEPRHLPALLAAIPGTVYRFTRESAQGSSEVLVYNFFASPDGSIESGPAGALNAATETQALGAAQFQILLGPTMTRDRRDEVFRTLIAAALPVMDALCVEEEA